jgi:hypothetical protein
MTWAVLSPWLVTLHVVAVLAFVAVHGVSMGVWWRVRRERDRVRLAAWLDLSGGYLTPMFVVGLALIASGILAGVAGSWWFDGRAWLWVSIGLLVAIVLLMHPMLAMPFVRLRQGLAEGIDDAELERRLTDPRPPLGAALGIGGLVVITWLMEAKPF